MNKKNNNVIVIVLLVIIFIIWLILGILFATNVISFNNENNLDTSDNISDYEKDYDENYIIEFTEEEHTSTNSSGVKNSLSKRNVVKITNNNNEAAAKKIQDKLNSISDKQWQSIIDMDETIKNTSYTDLGVNYLFETGMINSNRLTFNVKLSGSFGGVFWSSDEGYNFDATTGELLSLSDVVNDVNAFYDKCYDYLLKQVTDANLIDEWQTKVKDELEHEGNWYFIDGGLKLIFAKNSIASSSSGIITIEFSKDEVNDVLKDKYRIY